MAQKHFWVITAIGIGHDNDDDKGRLDQKKKSESRWGHQFGEKVT